MRRLQFFLASAAVLIVAACQSGTSPAFCLGIRPIAILVKPIDSITHASVATGAHGAVQSGTYEDSLRLISDSLLEGGDQLGTYVVNVERPGYQAWTRANVEVTQTGSCGSVIPVRLTALLQPTP